MPVPPWVRKKLRPDRCRHSHWQMASPCGQIWGRETMEVGYFRGSGSSRCLLATCTRTTCGYAGMQTQAQCGAYRARTAGAEAPVCACHGPSTAQLSNSRWACPKSSRRTWAHPMLVASPALSQKVLGHFHAVTCCVVVGTAFHLLESQFPQL